MNRGIFIVTAVTMAALSPPTVKTDCILEGSYPCCRLNALRDGRIRHDEYICFIFGQGLCQPFHAIPQIRLYVQLVQQLNETNYMELRRQYRKTLDSETTADLEDSYILPSKANAFVQQLYHGIAT
ncbi:Cys5 [Hyposoter didymator ichnovirus]|nr:Cys5 [Hyposoter didymator ichnovirus]